MALKKEDESYLEVFDVARKEKEQKRPWGISDSSRERESAFSSRLMACEIAIPIPSSRSSTSLAIVNLRVSRPDQYREESAGSLSTWKRRNKSNTVREKER